ncbi:hypothetical protein [Virgisporangium aliadipatigenens]|nr:hypothetical protein [Virgisporangium aliadipatigenens]
MPAEVVMRLARHPHLAVRRGVAGNEAAPASLLAALGTDGTLPPARLCYGCDASADPPPGMCCRGRHEGALVDLRYALVANPTTPPQTVAGWVEEPAMWVRWAVAERQDLPPEVYRRLAGDPVPGVRGEAAANPTVTESLIRVMASDDTNDVRRRLAHNPRVPLDVLAEIAPITRIGPALLPRIAAAGPAEVAQMARSPVAAVRMLLAARPDLPPEVVNLLAEDPDAKVLKSLAPNPALTEAQLRTMVARHGSRVVVRVAHNPTCSPGLLHELATHVPPVQKAYRIIAAHPHADAATLTLCLADHQGRPVAARHPTLPAATIIKLLDDPDERVAEAAAANPSLPRPAMETLLASWRVNPETLRSPVIRRSGTPVNCLQFVTDHRTAAQPHIRMDQDHGHGFAALRALRGSAAERSLALKEWNGMVRGKAQSGMSVTSLGPSAGASGARSNGRTTRR